MDAKIYKNLTTLCLPIINLYLAFRKRKGKEDILRFQERKGYPSIERPKGKIIWMHGASVGETVSMLPLVKKILQEDKNVHIIVTSGTVTSAEIMKNRLPARAFHQYIPVDMYSYAERFVNYWRPHVALWFESDFWPNLLYCTKEKNIPIILVNGRISNRSFKRWLKLPSFSRELQSMFTMSLGQTKEDAERLKMLGAKNVDSVGNLKFASEEAPYDENKLEILKKQTTGRIVFLAASTHFGEETVIAEIHKNLKQNVNNLLTIILPRHQNRGDLIRSDLENMNLNISQRSKNQDITNDTDIYLADTMGETGLFYRLSDVCFVGGSLVKHGGQNFLEPMKLNSATIVGPYMHNFKEMTHQALQKGAIYQVKNQAELQDKILFLLTDYKEKSKIIVKAREFTESQAEVLNLVFEKVKKWLD